MKKASGPSKASQKQSYLPFDRIEALARRACAAMFREADRKAGIGPRPAKPNSKT